MMPPKPDLRVIAREKRLSLKHASFAQAIANQIESLALGPGTIIGGYHALGDEADPALLLARLAEQGHPIAFPRVVAKDLPLEFHRVPDGEALRQGAYGVQEPLDHWPVVAPSFLLVPLLAFDAQGTRLGYGGGYYDRTLAALKHVRAIGIAYAGQEIASLPRDAHDMALDAILTEQGLRSFR